MDMLGKGNVKLKVNGLTHVISDVFFVPYLKTNLLSIGQLQDTGLTILIQNRYMNIYHPEKWHIKHTEMTTNRMFMLLTNSLHQKPTC